VSAIDIGVVLLWIGLSVVAGVWAGRGAKTAEAWFAADRDLPWWAVGTSMVATTFAADTPLVVAGYVASGGIARNWRWWWLGAAGMVSVAVFARLWRRLPILTDVELTDLRYSGAPARWLRKFKALWFGVIMNTLILAWVMAAMRTLVAVITDGAVPPNLTVGALFALAVAYTTTAGLRGVVVTDVLQFGLAMFGAVAVAVLSWVKVGGLEGFRTAFAAQDLSWEDTTALLPGGEGGVEIAWIALALWWTARQVDGGGYLAQRLFSARDERHATLGYLWFVIAHICLRPWPWVVAALAGLAWWGTPESADALYPMVMLEVLPVGLLGLVVASFFAAFMSTVDTQLHWGAALVARDLIGERDGWSTTTVARTAVIVLGLLGAIASGFVDDLQLAWELAFSITAGLGTVYAARWLWWRTNAFSEAAAMLWAGIAMYSFPESWGFPMRACMIGLTSPLVWIPVTYLTRPTSSDVLQRFWQLARPPGRGWAAISGSAGASMGPSLAIWGFGTVAVYTALVGSGWLLLGHPVQGLAACGVSVVAAWRCGVRVRKSVDES